MQLKGRIVVNKPIKAREPRINVARALLGCRVLREAG
jgi:hypothetical protein